MKLLTLIAILSIAGCDVVQLSDSETDSNPINSVYIQFKDGTDTNITCNKIIYDILRSEKITFFNDTETTTILINQIEYFHYE